MLKSQGLGPGFNRNVLEILLQARKGQIKRQERLIWRPGGNLMLDSAAGLAVSALMRNIYSGLYIYRKMEIFLSSEGCAVTALKKAI